MNRQKITAQKISAAAFAAGFLLIIAKQPHSFDVGVFFIMIAAAIAGWHRRRWMGMIGGLIAAVLGAMALVALSTSYTAGPLPAWVFIAMLSFIFAYASFRRIK